MSPQCAEHTQAFGSRFRVCLSDCEPSPQGCGSMGVCKGRGAAPEPQLGAVTHNGSNVADAECSGFYEEPEQARECSIQMQC